MRHIWLDCDPGHDDVTAILLALYCDGINLLGVSTVHGNASVECTAVNAARCLRAFGAPESVKVYPGAVRPLIRPARHDPEVHGKDGLGGVVGLPTADDPEVLGAFARNVDGEVVRALDGISKYVREIRGQGEKVSIISCGPMTNIALFVSVYPDLVDGVEQFVFMGGGVGVGNRSAVAEFNVLCDPEAAQIVLDVSLRKTMIPLNVTHSAIVTNERRSRLSLRSHTVDPSDNAPSVGTSTPLRLMLSSLIRFFADSYKSTFGFIDGPPLHDALTIAYVACPEIFNCQRHRVDVELNGTHTSGETVVDVWRYRSCDDTWGSSGRNCGVAMSVDVDLFFELFFECVTRCDAVSPLNK